MYIFVYFLSCKTSERPNQEVLMLRNADLSKSNVKLYSKEPHNDPVIHRLQELLSFQDIEYNKMVKAGFRDCCNSVVALNFDLTIQEEKMEFLFKIETMLNKLFYEKSCNFYFENIAYENKEHEENQLINCMKSAISHIYENNDKVDFISYQSNYVQNTLTKLSPIEERILKCNEPINVQEIREQNNHNVLSVIII